MAIAVISDIHANKEALEAVLLDIAGQEQIHKITEIHCLGDLVGYGPEPGECAEIIKHSCSVVLKGNHDNTVSCNNSRIISCYTDDAAESEIWTINHLKNKSPNVLDYLRNLPACHLPENDGIQNRIAEVHGTLCKDITRDDIDDFESINPKMSNAEMLCYATFSSYITPRNLTRCFESLKHFKRDICFVGHNHCPGAYVQKKVETDYGILRLPFGDEYETESEVELQIDKEHMFVCNVGSVGQPRDGDTRASYCIYTGDSVIYRRVPYAFEETMIKLLTAPNLPKRIAAKLAGRLTISN